MGQLSESKYRKWMKLCVLGAELFSTCAKRKYFSVIIDQHDHLVGAGWNGPPKKMAHCNEGGCPRLEENTPHLFNNYDNCIAIHAEQNSLLHSEYQARKAGAMLFINGVPCFSCAKLMVNGGIKVVVYLHEPDADDDKVVEFLHAAGVDTKEIYPDELKEL